MPLADHYEPTCGYLVWKDVPRIGRTKALFAPPSWPHTVAAGIPPHLTARTFAEERRRTKVIPPLWDEQSLPNLVFVGLMRLGECWGKKQCREFAPHPMRALRQSLALDQPLVTSESVTREIHPRRSAASAR